MTIQWNATQYIGRDILKELGFRIVKRGWNIKYWGRWDRDWYAGCESEFIFYAIKSKLTEKIQVNYLEAERPLESKVKAELKLHEKAVVSLRA